MILDKDVLCHFLSIIIHVRNCIKAKSNRGKDIEEHLNHAHVGSWFSYTKYDQSGLE
ncbi:MAG: hypothetical protein OEM77_05805 [Nitrosopumilus sp.]|nr:hypothetical protein [Nitrosopumilus sp.]MDH3736591.1 hypothetical protein [Nitrosopumilus sp.]MDH3823257.1 hypothetical protein [Nitrosopumilus sp.]MDH3832846.1 hypothetical protein [Nitrosopumilus sp.]